MESFSEREHMYAGAKYKKPTLKNSREARSVDTPTETKKRRARKQSYVIETFIAGTVTG